MRTDRKPYEAYGFGRRIVLATQRVLAIGLPALLIHQALATDSGIVPVTPGTVYFHELTIPPSDFSSPELKEKYAAYLAAATDPRRDRPKQPERNASSSEWDKYYADLERSLEAELLSIQQRYPADVSYTTMGGVCVGVITPAEGVTLANRYRVLINLHGGGFVDYRGLAYGQLESIPVAVLGGIKVVTIDYRQAPAHGFPDASEDVAAVYKILLTQYRPESIGIFGGSAGAALAAQSVSWFFANDIPRPGAIAMLGGYPPYAPPNSEFMKVGDARMWGIGIPSLGNQLHRSGTQFPGKWYLDNARPDDPLAYPGRFDSVLSRFPPTLLMSGTREAFIDAIVTTHARFLKLGVDSSLYIIEGGWHVSHVSAPLVPESRDAHEYIAKWFMRHLK